MQHRRRTRKPIPPLFPVSSEITSPSLHRQSKRSSRSSTDTKTTKTTMTSCIWAALALAALQTSPSHAFVPASSQATVGGIRSTTANTPVGVALRSSSSEDDPLFYVRNSYIETSRQYRRTRFQHDDWLLHRSPVSVIYIYIYTYHFVSVKFLPFWISLKFSLLF